VLGPVDKALPARIYISHIIMQADKRLPLALERHSSMREACLAGAPVDSGMPSRANAARCDVPPDSSPSIPSTCRETCPRPSTMTAHTLSAAVWPLDDHLGVAHAAVIGRRLAIRYYDLHAAGSECRASMIEFGGEAMALMQGLNRSRCFGRRHAAQMV